MIGVLQTYNRSCEERQATLANCTKLYWDDLNRLQAKTVDRVVQGITAVP